MRKFTLLWDSTCNFALVRLLARCLTIALMTRSPESDARTPLPAFQLGIILFIQAAEPITASVIFPFVNQFVLESGVTRGDERKVGYYAGIIGSLFFLSEFVTVLFWSRLSDRIGRKPVLLAGMVGLFVTILCAGLSKSYIAFALSRCIQGAFNGNVGVAKNVMVEITDSSNIADAFSFLPPVWTMGNTFGPLIGGSLANPGVRWPGTFGVISFFTEYPYFLPCATASFFALLCSILGVFFLRETHPTKLAEKKRRETELAASSSRNYGSINNDLVEDYSVTEGATPSCTVSSPSVRSVLVRPIVISLTTHAFQAVTMESFRTLLPLMLSTSIPIGGLAFSSARIGTIMAVWGFCNGGFQLIFFARAIRRFGPKKTFRIAYGSYAICFALYPVMSYFAKRANGVDAKVVCVLVLQLSCFVLGAMSYGSNQLFIIAAVPGQNSLATVNGLTQMRTKDSEDVPRQKVIHSPY
ncbi:MFS transporter superfamily protein [Pleurotus pulmonarius]